MISILWAFIGAAIAISLEVVYRRSESWPIWCAIPALVLTYAVYKSLNNGPSLLAFAVAFSLFTTVGRIAVSPLLLHEEVSKGNMVAAVALLVGTVISRVWR